MLYIWYCTLGQPVQGPSIYRKLLKTLLKNHKKSQKICLKTLMLYMVLHFRVASAGSFYLQKVIENSLKKIRKNIFKNIDAIYGIALQAASSGSFYLQKLVENFLK